MPIRNASRRQRRAFTLLELMVVLLILGLLASLASFSLRGVMNRYRLSRAAETLEALDARARRLARLSREPVEAVIRRHENGVMVRSDPAGLRQEEIEYRLPRLVEIGQVKLRKQVSGSSNVTIAFSDRGRSPTYAVELRRGDVTRWLVVLGISGQVIPIDSEEQADALLSLE